MKRRIFRTDAGGAPSSLGPLESKVMDVIWSLGGWVSVNDVLPAIPESHGKRLAYTTVKTVLDNLSEKKVLKKRPAGKQNVFRAAQSREALQQSTIDAVVGPLLRTQRNPLLAHLAGELAADDETYAELERLIAEKRSSRK